MGCIGSCIGSFLGSCLCTALGDACKTDSKSARIPYVATYFLFGIAAVAISQWGGTTLDFPFYEKGICEEICATNGAVFRISLCLVIFFAVHFVIMFMSYLSHHPKGLCLPNCGSCHSEFFMFKFLGLSVLAVASFWIFESNAMNQYADFARVFSGLFIVIQVVMLIGWAYDTNDELVNRMKGDGEYLGEGEQPALAWCIVLWCLAFIGVSIYFAVRFFGWYAGEGCGFNQFAIIFTIVFNLLTSAISITTNLSPHGNLFASSVVWFYTTFILYEALAADRSTCNTRRADDKSGGTNMWIGIILVTMALGYVGNKTVYNAVLAEDERDEVEKDAEAAENDEGDKAAMRERQSSKGVVKANMYFHLVMTFGSFYMAMLLSNWGTTGETETESTFSTESNLWILMIGQWLCMALYMWSLVLHKLGPLCCPGRDWDQDYD